MNTYQNKRSCHYEARSPLLLTTLHTVCATVNMRQRMRIELS